jgi:hypothetical protein
MRVLLTSSEIRHYANLGATLPTDPPGAFLTGIIGLFASGGHVPFTRKDLFAVAKAILGKSYKSLSSSLIEDGWNKMPNLPRDKAAGRGRLLPYPDMTIAPLDIEDVDGVEVQRRAGLVFMAKIPEVDVEDLGFYAEDPDLRLIAIAESKCFGNFDVVDDSCLECPLRAHCAASTYDALDAIARELDRATEKAVADAVRQVREAEVLAHAKALLTSNKTAGAAGAGEDGDTETPSVSPDLPLADVAERLGGDMVTTPFESNCYRCPESISAGEDAVIVRGSGALHAACARTLLSEVVAPFGGPSPLGARV